MAARPTCTSVHCELDLVKKIAAGPNPQCTLVQVGLVVIQDPTRKYLDFRVTSVLDPVQSPNILVPVSTVVCFIGPPYQ